MAAKASSDRESDSTSRLSDDSGAGVGYGRSENWALAISCKMASASACEIGSETATPPEFCCGCMGFTLGQLRFRCRSSWRQICARPADAEP